jgi:hypothetical protein
MSDGEDDRAGSPVCFTAEAGLWMVTGGLWGTIVGLVVLAIGHVVVTAPVTGYTSQVSVQPFGWAELILGMFVLAVGICGFGCLAWVRLAPRWQRRFSSKIAADSQIVEDSQPHAPENPPRSALVR